MRKFCTWLSAARIEKFCQLPLTNCLMRAAQKLASPQFALSARAALTAALGGARCFSSRHQRKNVFNEQLFCPRVLIANE